MSTAQRKARPIVIKGGLSPEVLSMAVLTEWQLPLMKVIFYVTGRTLLT